MSFPRILPQHGDRGSSGRLATVKGSISQSCLLVGVDAHSDQGVTIIILLVGFFGKLLKVLNYGFFEIFTFFSAMQFFSLGNMLYSFCFATG